MPYVMGALSGGGQEKLERHLLLCHGCQAELEALRTTSRILTKCAPSAVTPGADLTSRVLAEITSPAATEQVFTNRVGLPRWAAAGAVAVVVAVAGIGVGLNVFEPKPPTATRVSKSFDYVGAMRAPQSGEQKPFEIAEDAIRIPDDRPLIVKNPSVENTPNLGRLPSPAPSPPPSVTREPSFVAMNPTPSVATKTDMPETVTFPAATVATPRASTDDGMAKSSAQPSATSEAMADRSSGPVPKNDAKAFLGGSAAAAPTDSKPNSEERDSPPGTVRVSRKASLYEKPDADSGLYLHKPAAQLSAKMERPKGSSHISATQMRASRPGEWAGIASRASRQGVAGLVREEVESAFRANPSQRDGGILLELQMMMGDHKGAVATADKMAALPVSDPAIWLRMGEVNLLLNRKAQALAAYQKAAASSDSDIAKRASERMEQLK